MVEEKRRLADWEVETIVGARHQGAIVSLVEGKSKFIFRVLVKDSTAITVTAAIKKAFSIDPGLPIHTTTYDNGQEFSRHEPVAHSLSTLCYFASPYHSWQRGLNEPTNGRVRQYLPQKTNLLALDQSVVNKIQKSLTVGQERC